MRFAQGLFTVALIALLGVSYHHSRRSCIPQITRIETFSHYSLFCYHLVVGS